jgi:murein DD-endopeptidase MepM/ murein hydrolase activator NlpD
LRRALAGFAVVGALVALQLHDALASSPSPCPTPPASGARESCPATDPNQAQYDKLRTRLGGDLARALTSQQQLSAALNQAAASQQALTTQIAREEARIADLQAQIALLESQIADTQARIDVEQGQVAALARAIYRQPDSLLVLIAQTGNLHDALVASADLVVAGQRAHALQARLEADLAQLSTDRTARLADLDRENGLMDELAANLSALSDAIIAANDISNQLDALMGELSAAKTNLTNQPPDVTANLAALLEQQEQDLVQKAYDAAWSQAHVGAGLALAAHTLPAGTSLAGLTLSWPIKGARITQAFGPSGLALEPPFAGYPHFHTGIDLAAKSGTPVSAAANGVVVAVNHTKVGYGNYVIVAHGGGIMTLYAHLLETDVKVGDLVLRGQRIGREGSTGLATGPHLHFELRVNDEVTNPMPYLPGLHAGTTW